MTIVDTYSSWTRNRLTPDLRIAIAGEGPGEVCYHAAVGKPLGWVGCTVTSEGRTGSGVGADPGRAFDAAVRAMRQPIVSVLNG